MTDVRVTVGGSLSDDLAAFRSVWKAVEEGQSEMAPDRVLAFESWDGLAAVLTGERVRMLKHLHAHPEASVSSLARSLARPYRRVHGDVAALETAGLVDRSQGAVRATADRIRADLDLSAV